MALDTSKMISFNGTSMAGGTVLAQFYGTVNDNKSITVNENQTENLTESQLETEQADFDAFRTMVKQEAGDAHGE